MKIFLLNKIKTIIKYLLILFYYNLLVNRIKIISRRNSNIQKNILLFNFNRFVVQK